MESRLIYKLYKKFRFSGTNVLIVLAIIVGVATGFGALGFIALIKYFNNLFFGLTDQVLTGALGGQGLKFYLPLIPMLGGLLVGPIVYKFASEARGHGVPEVMNSVARMGGIIRPRVAIAKTVASAICIGSGGSAGREGPIVQIGSAIGSTIGRMLRMSGDRVKILVGCGAAAGISAIFNAPIAGVIFSLEIILGNFAIKTFSPVILSSVIASIVVRYFLGDHPAFEIPKYSLVSAWEIPLYIIMGGVMSVLGVTFTRLLDFIEDIFEKIKVNSLLKPAIGGLLLGVIAIFYPQILADGYETIKLTLEGNMPLKLLLVLIVMKLLATSMTLGSGNSGGIFSPSLFMGAVAGGAYGILVNYLFPEITAAPGAYALVGMAGMVAATTHAPITALLIIFEMTSDYHIILPLMVTVVFSALGAGKIYEHSIYTIKLAKKGINIKGGKDINVLRSHNVSVVMDETFQKIPSNMPLARILHTIEHANESYFIVTDEDDLMRGVLSFRDIRLLLTQHSLDYLIVAQDVVKSNTVSVTKSCTLEEAYQLFNLRDLQMMPVVEEKNSKKVIGVIRREALMNYYNKKLIDTLHR
ncbi:MAG: chloride channel protein [candidate division Zixibacteria bacterium]|nr:chloride channel protein [candidate division Zixibacteria bacterium]